MAGKSTRKSWPGFGALTSTPPLRSAMAAGRGGEGGRHPATAQKRNPAQHGIGAFGRFDGENDARPRRPPGRHRADRAPRPHRSHARYRRAPPARDAPAESPSPAISAGATSRTPTTGKPLASKKPTTPRRRLSSPPCTMRRMSSRCRTACQPASTRPSRGLCRCRPAVREEAPTWRSIATAPDGSMRSMASVRKAGNPHPRCRAATAPPPAPRVPTLRPRSPRAAGRPRR